MTIININELHLHFHFPENNKDVESELSENVKNWVKSSNNSEENSESFHKSEKLGDDNVIILPCEVSTGWEDSRFS